MDDIEQFRRARWCAVFGAAFVGHFHRIGYIDVVTDDDRMLDSAYRAAVDAADAAERAAERAAPEAK